MAKRLSDTAAIVSAGMASEPGMSESVSVDVRRIENGYVTRTSKCGSTGYVSHEVFSQDKPALASLGESEGAVGDEGFGGAMRALRSR